MMTARMLLFFLAGWVLFAQTAGKNFFEEAWPHPRPDRMLASAGNFVATLSGNEVAVYDTGKKVGLFPTTAVVGEVYFLVGQAPTPFLGKEGLELGFTTHCPATPMMANCHAYVATAKNGFVPRLIAKPGDILPTDQGLVEVERLGGTVAPTANGIFISVRGWLMSGPSRTNIRKEGVFRFDGDTFRSVRLATASEEILQFFAVGHDGTVYTSTYTPVASPVARLYRGDRLMLEHGFSVVQGQPLRWFRPTVDPVTGRIYAHASLFRNGVEFWEVGPSLYPPRSLYRLGEVPIGAAAMSDIMPNGGLLSFVWAKNSGQTLDLENFSGVALLDPVGGKGLSLFAVGDTVCGKTVARLSAFAVLPAAADRLLVKTDQSVCWLRPVLLTAPATYDAARREATLTGVNLNLGTTQVVANSGVSLETVGAPTATRIVARVPDNLEGSVTLRVMVGQVGSLNEATVIVQPPPTPPPAITSVENVADPTQPLIPGQEFVVRGERLRPARGGAFVTIGDLRVAAWFDERDQTLKGLVPENAAEGVIPAFAEVDGRRSNTVGVNIQRSGGGMVPPAEPTDPEPPPPDPVEP